MFKYTLTLLLILLTFTTFARKEKLADSTKLRLKRESLYRLKDDQMADFPNYFLNHSDSLAEVREARFIDNFKWLMSTAKAYGMPTAKLLYAKDSMDKKPNIEWQLFVPMALMHILQSQHPSLIFEEDAVQVIATALRNGELQKDKMAHGIWYYRNIKPCITEEQKVNHAMKAWGMDLFMEDDFSKCK